VSERPAELDVGAERAVDALQPLRATAQLVERGGVGPRRQRELEGDDRRARVAALEQPVDVDLPRLEVGLAARERRRLQALGAGR